MKKQQIIYRQGQATKDLISILDGYKDGVCTVTIEPGEPKKRSLDANALQHVWYKEIAEHTKHSALEIEHYLKLEIGLPIIRYDTKTEDEISTAQFIEFTFEKIEFDNRPYDQKLRIIAKTPVTRIMSRRQHKNFMEQIQAHYAPDLILEAR